MKRVIVIGLAGLLSLSGCAPQNKTQAGGAYGAAGGAAAGALIGQAVGHNTKSTLIGAAIGAAVGGLAGAGIGNMMDKQEEQLRQELAASNAAAVQREGNLLSIVLKSDMTFDSGSANVRPGVYSDLDRIASSLAQYPQTVIRIDGHTDNRGSEASNMDLSRRRAEAVRNLLSQRGVAASRMEVFAFGESSPVASNDTEAGRQMNRRVEIKVAPRN
ncbi:MAG: OmpA family protein [Thermodesulfobacteriota bacterium]